MSSIHWSCELKSLALWDINLVSWTFSFFFPILHLSGLETAYQANHLDASRIEFILELGKGTEFCRANRREICRVAEQDGPFAVQEFVKVLFAMSIYVDLLW
jgi:hypothetical protein